MGIIFQFLHESCRFGNFRVSGKENLAELFTYSLSGLSIHKYKNFLVPILFDEVIISATLETAIRN